MILRQDPVAAEPVDWRKSQPLSVARLQAMDVQNYSHSLWSSLGGLSPAGFARSTAADVAVSKQERHLSQTEHLPHFEVSSDQPFSHSHARRNGDSVEGHPVAIRLPGRIEISDSLLLYFITPP
jgi:hypothetical protein